MNIFYSNNKHEVIRKNGRFKDVTRNDADD